MYRGHALPGQVRTLPGAYYSSPALYEQESERIFARRWVCVGRADRIPETGDYFLADVAGESLLVVRDAGGPRAFFNVCRHRGTRLCEQASGRLAGSIGCPYHGWTYGLDGRLLGAPHMGDVEGFDKSELPLHAAPIAAWEGFLFVHLQPRPAALQSELAPLAGKFAAWRLGRLRPAHRIEYDVRANWKLLFQNFSECYHCPRIHPELTRLSHYRSGANDLTEGPILGGYMTIDPPGDSLTLSGRPAGPTLAAPGDDRRRVYYYSVFPSLLLTVLPDYALCHTLSPVAADRTRIVCEWLFPREIAAGGEGPQDAVAFWDRTNRQDWHVCELAQQGVSSRAYVPGPYSVQESLLAAFDREVLSALGRDSP
jgi:phenylpropionate dioxygenase-like ring-hydroxylating dioxygenase large terminal subunit